MKNFFKQFGKAICYFLLYFGVQNIVGMVYMMIYIVGASAEAAGKAAAAADLGMAAGEIMPDVEAITLGAIDYMMQNQNGIVIISGIITILFLLLFFLIRKKNMLAEANVTKTLVKNVPIAVGLGIGMMLTINFGLALLPESWLVAYSRQSNMLVEGTTVAIIISTMIMAPLIEELIFRGLMLSRLRKAVPDAAAIVITSLIFGLAHGQILWMTYTFVLGVVLAIVAVKSDSVIPSIILHMVFNTCGIVIPTLLGEFISGAVCVALLVIGILITAVLLAVLLKGKKTGNDALQTA